MIQTCVILTLLEIVDLEVKKMTRSEKMLIATIKASNLEVCALFLQDYIQRNGPVSDEAGDEIRKILAEKQKV